MNNDDERDFAEESYNASEYRREYEAEAADNEELVVETTLDGYILHEWVKTEPTKDMSREELFREEADKTVNRYFITQSGWVWVVHFIVDMPEKFDESLPNASKSLYRAKDGMTTLHMTSLYMSEEKAWDAIRRDIAFASEYDDAMHTHVTELDEL